MSRTQGGDAGLPSRLDKRKKRTERMWRIGLLVAAVLIFCSFFWLGTALYQLYGETYEPPEREENGVVIRPQPKPGESINILVLGLDDPMDGGGRFRGRSDTMMLVSLDPLLDRIGVLSVPRDTLVSIPGKAGPEKINHAHAYGGAGLAMDTVHDFLDVPVHYYLRLDFKGFVHVVDILGGVEIEVKEDMFYEDPYQDLHISIQKGLQKLDGPTALKYVRYRGGPDADIGRVGRQQEFLMTLLRQSLRMGTVLKLPQIISQVESHVSHNIPPGVVAQLVLMARRISAEDVSLGVVPGDAVWIGGVSYWKAEEEGTVALVEEVVLGIDREANQTVNVEVVDGTGGSGQVADLVQLLESWGYTVSVGEANNGEVYTRTQVISSLGDALPGKVLTRCLDRLLGNDVGAELFQADKDFEGPDIRIVYGMDFAKLDREGSSSLDSKL